jgi:hypothetical protein
LLSNLNDGRRRSLQILLSGQPALRDLLSGPAMEQFAQRIAVEYALGPLAEEEAIAYICHRIRVAGGRRPLFSTLACRKIFALTGGVPRLMNQLCDHALVYGYAVQAEMITAHVILDAARVRDRNGILPFRAVPDAIELSLSELDLGRMKLPRCFSGAGTGRVIGGDRTGGCGKLCHCEASALKRGIVTATGGSQARLEARPGGRVGVGAL